MGGTKRNETTERMPKNTIKTCNCEYVSNGKQCGRPPHFLHAKSRKVFCWNHYSRLSIVTSGWVNLQRSDAANAIDKLKVQEKKEPEGDLNLQPESCPS